MTLGAARGPDGASPGEAGGLDGAPGAPLALVGSSRTLARAMKAFEPDGRVEYRGVKPLHHVAKPENHPDRSNGCPLPSYAGIYVTLRTPDA